MNYSVLLRAALVLGLVSPPPVQELLNYFGTAGVLSASMAQGTTYYVSSVSGDDDANSGDSESSPWRSLQKVQDSNVSFNSGDQILFKSGEVFRGSLKLTNRDGVTIGTYGGGAPAIFKGSKELVTGENWTIDNGWTEGGTRYYVDFITEPDFISHVYEDGEHLRVARYPNHDDLNPEAGYLFNQGGFGTTIQTDALEGNSSYWNGAWAVVRISNFQYQMREVESHTESGTLDILDLKTSYNLDNLNPMNLGGKSWGYFLCNKLEELDAPGEWFYDTVLGRLYVMSNNSGQMTSSVEYVVESDGLLLEGCRNIVVNGIQFSHYNSAGIQIPQPDQITDNIIISNCYFVDLMTGIRDLWAPDLLNRAVINSTFERCYNYGIRASWEASRVEDCSFIDIGMEVGFAGLPQPSNTIDVVQGNEYGSYSALTVDGSNEFRRNYLNTIGNNGINVTGTGTIVENNYITKAISLLNDGGAITFDRCDECVIRENVVFKNIGVLTAQASDDAENEVKAKGIYLGNNVIKNSIVRDNVISDCSDGILVEHLEGYEGNVIQANTVFNCSQTQMYIQDVGPQNNSEYQASYDTQYLDNILYSLNKDQICQVQVNAWSEESNALVDFGNFDGNYYFNPYSDIAIVQQYRYTRFGIDNFLPYVTDRKDIPWSLDGWRNRFGEELNGVRHPLRLKHYEVTDDVQGVVFDLNPITSSTGWAGGMTAVTFDTETNLLTLQNYPWLENEDMYVQGGPNSPNWPPGRYLATFEIRSDDTDVICLTPVFDPNAGKHTQIYPIDISPVMSVYETLFEIPDIDPGTNGYRMWPGFANVHFDETRPAFQDESTLVLKSVKYEKVEVDMIDDEVIAANHLLRYNCPLPGAAADDRNVAANGGVFVLPENTLEMPLCGLWSDVDGNIYAPGESIALDPWQSIIVFQVDPPQTLAGMDVNNQFFIPSGATEIWDEHMNVQGSVVVQDGGTLIVDGATIGFAPSTQDITTNLEVKPGGTLIMRNGAHLTNWMGCAVPVGMWDGVKAGGSNTGPQPQVEMYTGSRISNAYTALMFRDGDPATPIPNAQGASLATGSRPKLALEGALFENNMHDIVLIPLLSTASTSLSMIDLDGPGGNDAVPSFIRKCTFRTSAALKQENAHPKHHLYLRSVHKLKVLGSTFENRRPDTAYSNPGHRGNGITGMNAQILVSEYDAQGEEAAPSVFAGLTYGVYASAVTKFVADVTRTRFDRCGGGIYLSSSVFARITENTFLVPDIDFTLKGVSASYGTYLESSTGFELEENVYAGEDDTDHPKVGAIFRNCGPEFNEYYRNTFANFRSRERNSMGTLIMGDNFGVEGGLKFKCNTYSAEPDQVNDLDIAMNGVGVRISANQGVNQSSATMAGNTFANFTGTDCGGLDERHLFVDADAVSDLNVFTYWHHLEQTDLELRPHCVSAPIVEDDPDPSLNWIRGTNFNYDNSSCEFDLGRNKSYSDAIGELGEVKSEYALLKQVYGDWSDGGDTEGLKDFILDALNGSYAVRNQLMLVAPKVSHELWELAFQRVPAMDPWHLAQALLANSPLELETMVLLDSSMVNPYYKQLVLDGQNGGVSMHSMYKGELSELYSRKSRTAADAAALALAAESQGKIDSALMVLDGSDLADERLFRAALLHWEGDHNGVRLLIDEKLAAEPNAPFWTIQDLAYEQLESNKDLAELDAAVVQQLQTMAQSMGTGAAEAQAWLSVLGEPYDEPVILPDLSKRAKPHTPRRNAFTWTPLSVFPNPSDGALNIAYEVPPEVQRAEVRVMDALGQMIFSDELNGTGVARMDVPVHATGLNIVALYFDGHLIGTEKVQMMKP